LQPLSFTLKTFGKKLAKSTIVDTAVLRIRIRIHRIHMFLGHPDPLVKGMDPDPALDPDPDPSIIMQK
jgi:hypothetical protein